MRSMERRCLRCFLYNFFILFVAIMSPCHL
uniref:Uncharacterized protein n=1 Tax=Myoviridae sp. cthAo37 TaxID=2827701 RepID=A0A8S5S4R2_9CAUD|nr:MAG TPA: hypothetical protein [Myoviridae sp. cthAo37]